MTNESFDSAPTVYVATLREMLGNFNEARCVLECAVRSLEQWQCLGDEPEDGVHRVCDPEIVCLRHT